MDLNLINYDNSITDPLSKFYIRHWPYNVDQVLKFVHILEIFYSPGNSLRYQTNIWGMNHCILSQTRPLRNSKVVSIKRTGLRNPTRIANEY
jgi:hypothetical protein